MLRDERTHLHAHKVTGKKQYRPAFAFQRQMVNNLKQLLELNKRKAKR